MVLDQGEPDDTEATTGIHVSFLKQYTQQTTAQELFKLDRLPEAEELQDHEVLPASGESSHLSMSMM